MGRIYNLYYDVISAHSWIMFERLNIARASTSDIIRFKPIHSANVLTAAGNKIPYYSPPLKKFYFHDIRFLGRLHGIPIKTPKGLIDELLLSATGSLAPHYLLTLIGEKFPDHLVDASQLMWTMLWVESRPIHDDHHVAEVQIIDMLGLPSSTIDELADEKWYELLNQRHEEAINSGCFGVPWLVVESDEELPQKYYGSDRWPHIQRRYSLGYQRAGQKFDLFQSAASN